MEWTPWGGFLVVLACSALAACGADPDPCTESGGPTPSHPVSCVDGANPVVLAEVPVPGSEFNEEVAFSKRHVVVDERYAYWSDYSGRILRTPKAGGDTDVLLEASDCSIADLAADGVGVYFGQNCRISDTGVSFPVEGTLAWIAKDDGTRKDLKATLLADVRHIAVSDGEVYGVFSREVDSSASLVRMGRDDNAATGSDTTLIEVDSVGLLFAVGAKDVVWFDRTLETIFRLPKINGSAEVVTSASGVESMFVVGSSVHFVERVSLGDSGNTELRLWRVPLAGGTPERLFDGAVTEFVAADGAGYYGAGFNTPDGAVVNRIYRWLPPKYEPEAIAAAIEWPQGVALDATHLFFVDSSMGDPFTLRLVRVAR